MGTGKETPENVSGASTSLSREKLEMTVALARITGMLDGLTYAMAEFRKDPTDAMEQIQNMATEKTLEGFDYAEKLVRIESFAQDITK